MHDHTQPRGQNAILAALPDDAFERLAPHFENIDLSLGQILFRAGETIEYVYFPCTAVVSAVAMTADGQTSEVAVIGNEGATGMNVILGFRSTLNENIVQLAGTGIRIRADAVLAEFARAGEFHDLLLHYLGRVVGQITRIALCNRLHPTEKRLARWLLMCRDRSSTDELILTQEFLSIMLGSNRPTVTMMAIELQKAGFIKYHRGHVNIINRQGLEDYVCDCYFVIKEIYSAR